MSGTNTVQVGPKAPQAGWLYAAAAVLVIVVVVAGGYGILQSNKPATGVGGPPSAAPTATAVPDATAASFTGSETCDTLAGAATGTTTTVAGVEQLRGLTYDCVAQSSDARLAGSGTATMNWDDYADGTEVMWGARVITNDGGTWRSVWNAETTTTATGVDFTTVFIGDGGYEGLVAPVDVHVRVGGTNSFAGTIIPGPPAIDGHETCVTNSNGNGIALDGITAYRGVVLNCTLEVSDPRVSGTGRNEVSIDERPDGSADIWGKYVLTNDGGTWEGYWAGTVDKGYTTHHVESLLVGTGDYDGLLYRLSLVTDATDTGYDLTGLIVPGP